MYKFFVDNIEIENVIAFSMSSMFSNIADSFKIVTNKKIDIDPLSMPDIEIYKDDEILLTGIILAPNVILSNLPNEIEYYGYSKTGLLEDCMVHPDNYPCQFDKMNLLQITDKLLTPFDIDYTYNNDDLLSTLTKKFESTYICPTQTIKDYITRLAGQRNVYITNNEKGELVYYRYNENTAPIASFTEGDEGLKQLSVVYDPQSLHSHITVLKQATDSSTDNAQYTIKNPYMSRYRPFTKVSCAGDNFDIEKAARNILAKELSGIRFKFDINQYIKTGSTIILEAPSLNINEPTSFFVESSQLSAHSLEEEKSSIECVYTDVYTNSIIE